MRPPRFAAEYATMGWRLSRSPSRFNEAAAFRGGIQANAALPLLIAASFNEAAAFRGGILRKNCSIICCDWRFNEAAAFRGGIHTPRGRNHGHTL